MAKWHLCIVVGRGNLLVYCPQKCIYFLATGSIPSSIHLCTFFFAFSAKNSLTFTYSLYTIQQSSSVQKEYTHLMVVSFSLFPIGSSIDAVDAVQGDSGRTVLVQRCSRNSLHKNKEEPLYLKNAQKHTFLLRLFHENRLKS